MRVRTIVALLFTVLLARPAWAQEQKGVIEGSVLDSQGKSIPGATVEAKSSAGATLSATTDASGMYRFPSVQPGTYEVSAKLTGFKPGKVADVRVTIEAIKKVDFTLEVGSVNEQVTVTGASPLVDVRSSERSTIIRGGDSGLPGGRDFTTLVTQAPGANAEAKSGLGGTTNRDGLMIDGAAAAENRYIVDGMETTDMVHGQSGKALLTDFVEEIQVKSTGYPAEFGGATGGVINVITKSGTNKTKGSVVTYFEGSKTQGKPVPTLRLNLTNNALPAEYVTYPKDKLNRNEVGGTLGGPIMSNKAWFFAAYQPVMIKTIRTVTPASSNNPNANGGTNGSGPAVSTTNKNQIQYFSVNETMQLSAKLRTRVAFNNSWRKTEGQLNSIVGTDKIGTDYTKGTKLPNYAFSATADYSVSQNFVIGARAGRFLTDTHDFNVQNVVQYTFTTSNLTIPGVPAQFLHSSGYSNVPSNTGTDHDTLKRDFFQVDATYFAHGGGGDHQIKGGVQFDRRSEDVITGDLQNDINITWGGSCGPNSIQGTFGCYEVRSNTPSPRQGIITQGDVRSNVSGIFLQDTWTPNPRLTINGGVRTESENVPAYTKGPGIADSPIKFSWSDKVAPRAGFAFDLTGNGKSKLYASWGVFYDIFKLQLPQGSFGGQKWISYYFTLDTPNFESLRDSASCPPTCPGTPSTPRSIDFRAVSVTPGLDVEPDLKPMRSQEMSVGFEHQISNLMSGSVRFVHKQLDRAIDDIGDLGPDGEAYIIANPGEGVVAKYDISQGISGFSPQGFTNLTQTMPKAKRDYNSVEFAVRRQFSNNYLFNVSYLWSRDAGNYSGLSQSDENGRSDPNVGRDFDYPVMQFDGTGRPLDGPLNTDRPHQVKFQGLYMTKWGTTIGVNEYIQSGIPLSRQINIIPGDNYPIFYRGRGSDGRTPVYSQTDLSVQHAFKIGGGRNVTLTMNVLNLLNQRAVTDRNMAQRRTGAVSCSGAVAGSPNCTAALDPLNTYSEKAFYAGQINWDQVIAASVARGALTLNPRFGMDSAFQAPIQARFGAKFMF